MKIVIHGNGLGVGCLLCKLKGICKHEQFLRSNQFFLETNQLRGHDTIYLQKPNLLQNKHFTSYTREIQKNCWNWSKITKVIPKG